MAFSICGTTVSSKPSTPGMSDSSEAIRAAVLRRISSATGTDLQPEARSSPRVRARSAGGWSVPGPGVVEGSVRVGPSMGKD